MSKRPETLTNIIRTDLQTACERFIKEWPHFIKSIDWNHSNLDAAAISFFNEVPGTIKKALEKSYRKEIAP